MVVLPIGMVGRDVRDHMMGRVHTELAQVVQLPCLAGLYTDTGIRVGGTVVCFVAGVFRALVARTRTLVLVPRPPFVPAL